MNSNKRNCENWNIHLCISLSVNVFFYFTGNADPVFYFCFDSLNNVQLMEGAVTSNFNGLVDGKVNISPFPFY